MPNPTVNRRVILSAPTSSYDPVAASYFSRAGISDETERTAVNTLVLSMRANTNIWNSLSVGFVYLVSPTSYGASLHDLFNNFNPSEGVAPNYATTGWFFDGATQYLKTGLNPNTSMTINTGYIYVQIRNNKQESGDNIYGATDAGGNTQWLIATRGASDNARFNAYDSATVMTAANANSSGRFSFGVLANNSRYIRRNEASLGTSAATVGGSLPNLECYLGCRNLAGAAASFVNYEIPSFAQGFVGLSTSDADAFALIMKTYNDTVISGGR